MSGPGKVLPARVALQAVEISETLDTVVPTTSNPRATISVGGYVFINNSKKTAGANGSRYIS